jgi:glucan 1,3-beta-glucosidase
MIVLLTLAGIIFVFLAIFLPVFFVVARKSGTSSRTGSAGAGAGGAGNPQSPTGNVVSCLTFCPARLNPQSSG